MTSSFENARSYSLYGFIFKSMLCVLFVGPSVSYVRPSLVQKSYIDTKSSFYTSETKGMAPRHGLEPRTWQDSDVQQLIFLQSLWSRQKHQMQGLGTKSAQKLKARYPIATAG